MADEKSDESEKSAGQPRSKPRRPWWRRRATLISAGVVVVLIAGGVVFVSLRQGGNALPGIAAAMR